MAHASFEHTLRIILESAMFPAPALSSGWLSLLALTTWAGVIAVTFGKRCRPAAWLACAGPLAMIVAPSTPAITPSVVACLLAALWLSRPFDEPERLRGRLRRASVALLHFSLLISIDHTIESYAADITGPYSGGHEMAEAISEREIQALAVQDSVLSTSVLAHLAPMPIWQLDVDRAAAFGLEDGEYRAGESLPQEILIERARTAFSGQLPWLLTVRPLQGAQQLGYNPEFGVWEGIHGAPEERFFLYRPAGLP